MQTGGGESLEEREQLQSAVEIKHQPLERQITELETVESLHDPAILFPGLHLSLCVSKTSLLMKSLMLPCL